MKDIEQEEIVLEAFMYYPTLYMEGGTQKILGDLLLSSRCSWENGELVNHEKPFQDKPEIPTKELAETLLKYATCRIANLSYPEFYEGPYGGKSPFRDLADGVKLNENWNWHVLRWCMDICKLNEEGLDHIVRAKAFSAYGEFYQKCEGWKMYLRYPSNVREIQKFIKEKVSPAMGWDHIFNKTEEERIKDKQEMDKILTELLQEAERGDN